MEAIAKGIMSVYENNKGRTLINKNYLQLYFNNKEWFNDCEFFTLHNDLEDEYIHIKKHYIDVPNNARISQQGSTFCIIAEIPLGKYEVDEEESNEDELVIYYN